MDISAIIAGPEVTAAVAWWAGMLGRGDGTDIGDEALSAAVAPYRATRPANERERDGFRRALCGALERRWRNLDAAGGFVWDARRPEAGSPLRTLAVDYRPDATLAAGLMAAGYPLSATALPIKTTMWIDPGWVTVRRGYDGESTILYPSL